MAWFTHVPHQVFTVITVFYAEELVAILFGVSMAIWLPIVEYFLQGSSTVLSWLVLGGLGSIGCIIMFEMGFMRNPRFVLKPKHDMPSVVEPEDYSKFKAPRQVERDVIIDGPQFRDIEGRRVHLRGINVGGMCKLPYGSTTHQPTLPYGDGVTFVGRPFPLNEADVHLARLRAWGLTFLRFLVSWEALEPRRPGEYDREYINYVVEIIRKCREYGISVVIDPHQDAWCRWTGGDGAPRWTLEKIGMNPDKLSEAGVAVLHQDNLADDEDDDPKRFYLHMIWPTNNFMYAAATMWAIFFAGEDYAPNTKIADALKDEPNVLGFETLNEPNMGWVGRSLPLDKYDSSQPLGFLASPWESIQLAQGHSVSVPNGGWLSAFFVTSARVMANSNSGSTRATLAGSGENTPLWCKIVGLKRSLISKIVSRTLNENNSKVFLAGYNDPWYDNGVWDYDNNGNMRLLKKRYFDLKTDEDFQTRYMRPFWRDFAKAVTSKMPDGIIFLGPALDMEKPKLHVADKGDAPADTRLVWAPHWYDGLTFQFCIYRTWTAIKASDEGLSIGFGPDIAARIHAETLKHLASSGDAVGPTLLGETGVQWCGDYEMTDMALNDSMCAIESSYVPAVTLWNYAPGNNFKEKDGWNDENLSIFTSDPNPRPDSNGGPHLRMPSAVRPYAFKLAGKPVKVHFNGLTPDKTFTLRFEEDPACKSCVSEIFVPLCIHYRNGIDVQVSDGSWKLDEDGQTLLYRHDPDFVCTAVHFPSCDLSLSMGTQIRTTLDPKFQHELDQSPLAPDDISRAVAMFVEERVFTLQQLGQLPEKEFEGLMNEQQPRLQRGIKVVLKDLWSTWHKWAEQKKKEEELAQKERIREEEKLKRIKEKEEMKLQAADLKRRMQEEARQQKLLEREKVKEQERIAREKLKEEEKLARQAAKEKAKEEERLRKEEERKQRKERGSSAKSVGKKSSVASGRRQSSISSFLITPNAANVSPGKAPRPSLDKGDYAINAWVAEDGCPWCQEGASEARPRTLNTRSGIEEIVGSAEPSLDSWRSYWRKERIKFTREEWREWDRRRFISKKSGDDGASGSQSAGESQQEGHVVPPAELDTKGATTAVYAFGAAKPADSRERYTGRRKPRCVLVDLDDRDRPPVQLIVTCDSKAISGRNPFGKDPGLDYEVDSDAEWEEQDEGEEIGDDDEDSDDDDTVSEADSGVVSDGKLSADEMSEDEECAAAERELIKKKTRKRRSATVLATSWISLEEIDAEVWPSPPAHPGTQEAFKAALRETVLNDFTVDTLDQNLLDAPGEDDPKPVVQPAVQAGGASGAEGPMKSPSGSDAGQPSDSDANGGGKSQQQRRKIWNDVKLRRKLAKFVHANSIGLDKLRQGFEEKHSECAGCGTAAQIKRIAKYERRGANSCMAWWVTPEAIKELKLQPKTMENLAEKRSWSLHRSAPVQSRKRRKPGPTPPTNRETANSGGGESGDGGSDSAGGEETDVTKQDAKRIRRITDYFPTKASSASPTDEPKTATSPSPQETISSTDNEVKEETALPQAAKVSPCDVIGGLTVVSSNSN
ncbi:hypothetical protein FOL47_008403 [Perkinsus chesapeaki]|uniref:Glycoside hydrolase family 5 domain-containing protein n=1 Tax=Perkinsus chesapeaki TaxID=330153 RepID=A0A7J6LEP0_PERCH|nr:hypothetical protein FOL47_008403 [Perkinsus chesapeaki]